MKQQIDSAYATAFFSGEVAYLEYRCTGRTRDMARLFKNDKETFEVEFDFARWPSSVGIHQSWIVWACEQMHSEINQRVGVGP
jgi:hypothetical protein